jgi:formate dehydrogenase major subunit
VLIKRTQSQRSGSDRRGSFAEALAGQTGGLDRRAFLRRSGVAGGALAALSTLPVGGVRKAEAAAAGPLSAGATVRKSICTHCSVGCTVTAEVLNGVWVGQEPSWDSPINRGSHCAKGASVRELVHSVRRLRYPMKLVNGQWTRVSWEAAVNEIGDKLLEVRENLAGLACGRAADGLAGLRIARGEPRHEDKVPASHGDRRRPAVRGCRAAKQRYEFATLHVLSQAQETAS